MACTPWIWPATREEVLAKIEPALRESYSLDEAAERLGVTRNSLAGVVRAHQIDWRSMTVAPAPASAGVPASGADSEDLRARVRELEEQLSATHEEQGSAAPGRDSTILLLFDLHVPEHDRPAVSSVLAWAREHQPDEVILSEPAEWLSLSQHGGNWGASWDRDKSDVRRFLVQLRSVVPEARITWQQTNHDSRLDRILEERLPSFAGSLSIPRELDLASFGVEWVPERVVLRRGALKIIHGHQLATSDKSGLLPKYHAARAVQLYGEPGVTVVYGHTHKTQAWAEPCDGGDKRAVNIGCLRTLRPAWLRAREAGWLHQFAVAYVAANGATNLYPVDVRGGAFTWAGKRYAA